MESIQHDQHLTEFLADGDGLRRMVVSHPAADGEVYLQGAHVTRWQPKGYDPVLHVTARSRFEKGVAIRGGVPICFPWFGPKEDGSNAPAHGFARVLDWELDRASASEAEGYRLRLVLKSNEQTLEYWPADFEAVVDICFGRELIMKLSVTNRGKEMVSFEEALHSYFNVADVRKTTVSGLAGIEYIDKTDAMRRRRQDDDVVDFKGEVDRLYVNTRSTCTIDDAGRGRKIEIAKSGSDTTVVWNPGPVRAATMSDIGPEGWSDFVCVETANAGENRVQLRPGERHEMAMTFRVT